jgi:hypothetical protein
MTPLLVGYSGSEPKTAYPRCESQASGTIVAGLY